VKEIVRSSSSCATSRATSGSAHPSRTSVPPARPDAIVVEAGLPDGTATIDTYGAGKVDLEAAADSFRASASV